MNNAILQIKRETDRILSKKGHAIVAIDGNCGSGKSTLAGVLEKEYSCNLFHMDDYFYPTTDSAFDAGAYAQYCASAGTSPLSLSAWRTDNINQLVSGLYQAIHTQRQSTQFGISPQGNIENCETAGADVRTWVSTPGYVYYLCPQLYYNEENPSRPFTETALQWRTLTTCESVQLYAGLALYKAGDPEVDNGTWTVTDDQIQQQLHTLSESGYSGFALYSYQYLIAEQTSAEMQNIQECLGILQNSSAPAKTPY